MCWRYELEEKNDEGISYPTICTDHFWTGMMPYGNVDGYFSDWLWHYVGARVKDNYKLRELGEEFLTKLHEEDVIEPREDGSGGSFNDSIRKMNEEGVILCISEDRYEDFIEWWEDGE